jgi:5-methylcytosine-specific restriction protein B
MARPMELSALALFTGAQILAEYPDGLRGREVWPLIVREIPDIEEQWASASLGNTTLQRNFDFYTINLVKSGWLRKSGGRWWLTSVGRVALREYPSAQMFFDRSAELYSDWKQNQARFDTAMQLIEAVPSGNWAGASELAGTAGLPRKRLIEWSQGLPREWFKVLHDDGSLPAEAHPDEGGIRERWLEALGEDGIQVLGGRAEESARIPAAELRELISEVIDGEAEAARRAWLIRGSNVQGQNLVRDLWLSRSLCSLAAARLRDVTSGASRDQVRAAVDRDYAHASVRDRLRLTAEYHAFLSRMRPEDIVVTNDSARVYLGEITGEATFVAGTGNRANLQRPVQWINTDNPVNFTELPDEVSARVGNPDADVIELTEFIGDLERLMGMPEPEQAPTDVPFTLPDITEAFAGELLLPQDWLQECVELLRERAQLIFYGPPGTGKTYLARKLANLLADDKPENVQRVQFHPAYSYEDFVEGFRPAKNPDGGVAFELTTGPLLRLATAARNRSGDAHVLIIDEINRGNLAKIFGELYFLLEYRGESVNLLYGSDDGLGFTLPRNIVLLGTMNSADRSIAHLDMAMRRRFWFVEMQPDEPPVRDLLGKWLKKQGQPDDAARLLGALNNQLGDPEFLVGPSYLMSESATTPTGLNRIWRTQIMPLLADQYPDLSRKDLNEQFGLSAIRALAGLTS